MTTLAPPGARGARALLFGYGAIALVMTQLPPLFPPNLPALHVPLWYLLALLACGTGALTARPAAHRRLTAGLCWVLLACTVVQAFVVADLIAMFCSWLVVPAMSLLAGRLPRRQHKALVAAHVVSSASWVGTAVTFVAMSVVALTTEDVHVAAVVYELMATFDTTLLPWANLATSLSGIALGLTTAWGLVTYHWVVTKLSISVAILVMAFGFLHDALESAGEQAARLAAAGGGPDGIDAAADVVFWGFGVALLSLVAALLLSLYKPGGRTRWGRRKRTAPGRPAIPVVVAETRTIAADTVALTLRSTGGGRLPGWEPGAHIDLVLPSGRVRQYSLCGDPAELDEYRVAVLREPAGRGGSAEIHQLRAGARLRIRGPRNHFPLETAPAHLFIAGGIGITPFLPMIRRLHADGAPWLLLYRGRSLRSMPFADALARQYPHNVRLAPADTTARPDLHRLLAEAPAGVGVYCCGPASLLDAVAGAMPPHGVLHTERFAAADRGDHRPDLPFDAELRRTGSTVHVPAGRTLLAAIHDVDPTLDASCEEGVCGSCITRVLAGAPDHRDSLLEAHERDRTDVIYPCVSRAHGGRIVLDI
ncbi:ferredoxin-NADP reductase [Pseudonocardia hierapolitana]|uniref:Ferredoxin-NADP reductase n=1 Tax=Pseudonocardia hierapolitana TaxID=1128676 RepID=A0A561SMC5_9PSEU|nr:PDR/VanB family oxidoreductase [Pseudonocardia hierapolitana]TWF76017.1 ferredoxin-NADP reductase [Pseudonocardia hierapolitana]